MDPKKSMECWNHYAEFNNKNLNNWGIDKEVKVYNHIAKYLRHVREGKINNEKLIDLMVTKSRKSHNNQAMYHNESLYGWDGDGERPEYIDYIDSNREFVRALMNDELPFTFDNHTLHCWLEHFTKICKKYLRNLESK